MKKKNNSSIDDKHESIKISPFNKVVRKIFCNHLFWVLMLIALFRFLYYFSLKPTFTYSDSISYLLFNANIFQGEIDAWRTPIYPAFIKLIQLFWGSDHYMPIVIAQALISFVSVIVFYQSAKLLFHKRVVIISATIIYGIMPTIIDFDLCVLSESLSISTMVFIFYFFIRFQKEPTTAKAIFLTLMIFLSIMLRPAFLSLLAVITMFWFARLLLEKGKRQMYMAGIASAIFSVVLLIGYSRLNYKSTGCNTISISSTTNQFDIVVNSGIYNEGDDVEIIDTITKNIENNQLPWNDKAKYAVLFNFPFDRVTQYIKSCILSNPRVYISHAIFKLIHLGRETTSAAYAIKKGGIPYKFATFVNTYISFPFVVIYFFLFVEFVVLFIQWFFRKNKPWLRSVLLAFIIIQLITIAFGAQAEYQRLFSPSLPLTILLFFFYVEWIMLYLKEERDRNYLMI